MKNLHTQLHLFFVQFSKSGIEPLQKKTNKLVNHLVLEIKKVILTIIIYI